MESIFAVRIKIKTAEFTPKVKPDQNEEIYYISRITVNMTESKQDSFKLIGIALDHKTTNENNQSSTDCGNLWQRFEKDKIFELIPNKVTQVSAVRIREILENFARVLFDFMTISINSRISFSTISAISTNKI